VAAASPSPAGPASIAELLESTTRALVEELDVAACAISRVVGDLLVDIVGYARDRERLFLGYGYLISEYPVTRHVLERRVPRWLTLHDSGVDEREAAVLRDLGYESLLMLPLVCDAECWGLAEIYVNGRRFTDEDVSVAAPLAEAFGDRLASLPAPTSAR
jgi:GAF domain-containing protein